jgi:hypothetical protein
MEFLGPNDPSSLSEGKLEKLVRPIIGGSSV